MEINFAPFPLQYKALNALFDDHTKEILFGGSMASGKSFLSAAFATLSCIAYPGIHIGIFRTRLTDIKRTFMPTIMEFFKKHNISENKDYTIDRSMMIITFNNGSKIFFGELQHLPSDPGYERVKGMNLTHAILDEASMISYEAFQIISTRIRYKLQEYGIIGKILIVTNPCKNWVYERYYKPYVDNELDYDKAVILGKPTDNFTITQEYVDEQKNRLSDLQYAIQIEGNWEYSESDYNIINYEDLLNAFYVQGLGNGEYYISADIADKGKDRTSIVIWRGLAIVDIIMSDEWTTDIAEEKIKSLMNLYNVKVSNVVIDSDGLGVGVANKLKGCYHFKGGSSAINKENFRNLKTQVILKMAGMIAKGEVRLLEKYRDTILKELSLLRYEESDKDRIEIENKEKQKRRNSGKSPDLLDSIMMRFVFEIKKRNIVTIM